MVEEVAADQIEPGDLIELPARLEKDLALCLEQHVEVIECGWNGREVELTVRALDLDKGKVVTLYRHESVVLAQARPR